MISLILPIYNDAYNAKINIPRIIRKMNEVREKFNDTYEIIIVEESSDSTQYIIKKFAKENKNIIHIHSDRRLGKGGALKKGITKSRGNKIFFMDIDLSTGMSAVENLIKKLDEYDIVVGSRFHPDSEVLRPHYRSFLGLGLSIIVRLLFGIPVRDTQCGFKGYRKEPIRRILKLVKNNEWFWDIEVFYYAKKFSYGICEIPVAWRYNKLKSYGLFGNIFFYMKSILRFIVEKNG